MKKKSRSVKIQIFKYYALLIAFTLLAFSTYEFLYVFNNMKSTAYQELESIAQLQSNAIDAQISIMDTAATNLLFTQSAQNFLSLNLGKSDVIVTNEQQLSTAQELTNQLASYVAPSYSVCEAIIHNYHGIALTSRTSYYKEIDLTAFDWYDDVIAANGLAFITPVYPGNDPEYSTDTITPEYLISLCRCVFNVYNQNIGIVEIRQYAYVFFDGIESLDDNDYYETIIFDANQTLVYPYDSTPAFTASDHSFFEELIDDQPVIFSNYNQDGRSYVMCAYRSHETQYTVVTAIPTVTVYETPLRYAFFVLAIAAILMLCLLLISFYLSQRLTAPLSLLEKQFARSRAVSQLTEPLPYLTSGITEIDSLSSAYNDMNIALQDSIHDLMLSQQQQLQFKMLALQSQMNPHFLHNCLANIAAMAEDDDTAQITYMCKNLSGMLRYVVSDNSESVTIADELHFAKQYISTMNIRFGDYLQCSFDIPPALEQQKLPRMSLQPLLENSIKASKNIAPPWTLAVSGAVHENGWTLIIEDNACGFSEESKQAVFAKIASMEQSGVLPEMKIDGMGLFNVYIRLRLLYGSNVIFEIENRPQGGSKITLGTKEVTP